MAEQKNQSTRTGLVFVDPMLYKEREQTAHRWPRTTNEVFDTVSPMKSRAVGEDATA